MSSLYRFSHYSSRYPALPKLKLSTSAGTLVDGIMFAEEMQQYMNRLLDLEGSAFLPDLLKYGYFYLSWICTVFWNFQCQPIHFAIILPPFPPPPPPPLPPLLLRLLQDRPWLLLVSFLMIFSSHKVFVNKNMHWIYVVELEYNEMGWKGRESKNRKGREGKLKNRTE